MPAAPGARRRATVPAVAGLVLGVLGVVAYFVIAQHLGPRLPWLRNHAVGSWIVIAAGLALSVLALLRAERRLLPGVLLALNVVVAGAFAAVLYVVTAVPPVTGPRVGAPAPPFALVDQSGKSVRLADYRGAPVLLVFYRGHW